METQSKQTESFPQMCIQALEGSYGPLIQTVSIILLVLIFNFIIKKILLKLHKKFEADHKIWKLSFVSAIYLPLSYFVWFFAGVISLDIILSHFFVVPLPTIKLIISIGAVLAFGWFLIRWKNEISSHMFHLSLKQQIDLTPSSLDFISKIATIGILVITVFLLMDVTGGNLSTLIAFGGISGLALAFASQQFISNFFGGLMIYLSQPFTIGEKILLPDRHVEGYIEEIGWNTTIIRDTEKRPIYVPNSVFSQGIVINPTRMSHMPIHLKIELRSEDIIVLKDVIEGIREVLFKNPKIDQDIKPRVFFVDFGQKNLEIEITAYISTSSEYEALEIKQDVLFEIASVISQKDAEVATATNIVEIKGNLNLG